MANDSSKCYFVSFGKVSASTSIVIAIVRCGKWEVQQNKISFLIMYVDNSSIEEASRALAPKQESIWSKIYYISL